jgi:DNA-binding NarL/FixJ family response regulator
MKSILFIEEQNLFRTALASLIENFDSCSKLQHIAKVEEMVKDENDPELVIVSIYDIREHGEHKINAIQNLYPLAGIMVFVDEISKDEFSLLIELGVYAVISMDTTPSEIDNAIANFDKYGRQENIIIDHKTRERIQVSADKAIKNNISFTQRELEVLNLVCLEQTNVEISQTLGLSIRTIESFRRRMILKTGCKNMIGVVLKAIQISEFKLLRA